MAVLDRTDNRSMEKDDNLQHCTETCQVYSHDVKQKCIKFTAIPTIFWNFGGGLKLQGITKKFHLYISGKIYWLLPGI